MLDQIEEVIELGGAEYYKLKDSAVLVGCSDFNRGLVAELKKCYSEIADKEKVVAELAWPENCEHEFVEVKNEKVSGVKMCIHCYRVEAI